MKMKKILLYVDSLAKDQHAAQRAATLANCCGAELKVVDVVSKPPSYVRAFMEQFEELHETVRRERLESLVTGLRDNGVSAEGRLLHGRPFVEIIHEVARSGHNLVIKNAGGVPGHGKTLAGPVDMRLFRNCQCPVWLIKPPRPMEHHRVLAALAPDADDSRQSNLNVAVLRMASWLARSEGSELHAVCVWDAPGESWLLGRVQKHVLHDYTNGMRGQAGEALRSAFAEADIEIADDRVHLCKGEAAPMITETLQKTRADCLVIGTVARTGIPGLLIGNTAETILRQVECSVLAVKPDGFVSPVL